MRFIVLLGEKDGRIWMWYWCFCCLWIDGVFLVIWRFVMFDVVWGFLFGKFLELSFLNYVVVSCVVVCGYFLYRDCLRFYGYDILVFFFWVLFFLCSIVGVILGVLYFCICFSFGDLLFFLYVNYVNRCKNIWKCKMLGS